MKIKLDQKLLDLDGEIIQDGKKDAILRNHLVDCLTRTHVVFQNGQAVPEQAEGKEKFERYELARKIKNAKEEIEAKSEEVTKLKELSGKLYSPIVTGAIYDMLEGTVTVK